MKKITIILIIIIFILIIYKGINKVNVPQIFDYNNIEFELVLKDNYKYNNKKYNLYEYIYLDNQVIIILDNTAHSNNKDIEELIIFDKNIFDNKSDDINTIKKDYTNNEITCLRNDMLIDCSSIENYQDLINILDYFYSTLYYE